MLEPDGLQGKASERAKHGARRGGYLDVGELVGGVACAGLADEVHDGRRVLAAVEGKGKLAGLEEI